jgi:hypothetical protein
VRIAQRTGRLLPARGTRLWVTELNWDYRADGTHPTSRATLLRWIPRGLYLLWREGVDLVTWQFVRDPPAKAHHPAGLYAADPAAPGDAWRDRPKPAFAAFRFPFFAQTRARGRVEVWALLPPGAGSTASLQRRQGGRWRPLATVRANGAGMVSTTLRLGGRPWLRVATRRRGASPAFRVATYPRTG